MVTREQVDDLMNRFKNNKPNMLLKKLDYSEMGMRLVMCYLYEHPKSYAINISKELNISRERVRVLLKKLEEKRFIQKSSSSTDARIELIELTESGIHSVEEDKKQRLQFFTSVIEEIGYDKMVDFVDTMTRIRNILQSGE